MFETPFQASTYTRGMRVGMAQGELIFSVLFSLYVNNIPTPSYYVELALYAADTANIATSRMPALFAIYLESYFSDLQRWLRVQDGYPRPEVLRRSFLRLGGAPRSPNQYGVLGGGGANNAQPEASLLHAG